MGDDVSYKYGFSSSLLRISVSIPDFYELGDWVAAPGAWFSSTWHWAFFCQNQVMMKDPPPLEARASMSGDVKVQSCFIFLELLLLENINLIGFLIKLLSSLYA